jgi:hypothetical protein
MPTTTMKHYWNKNSFYFRPKNDPIFSPRQLKLLYQPNEILATKCEKKFHHLIFYFTRYHKQRIV